MAGSLRERMERDGVCLREASEADVRAFCDNLAEDDFEELTKIFGIPADKIADEALQAKRLLKLYILSFKGDDCVLCGVCDDDGVCFIFTHTSKALARHKVRYVKWMEAALVSAIVLAGGEHFKDVRTLCWKQHRVCRTIERCLDAEVLGQVTANPQLWMYGLRKIERALEEVRNGFDY